MTRAARESALPVAGGPREVYRWGPWAWNVTELLADVEAGSLRPQAVSLGTDFIDAFATRVLGLNRNRPPVSGTPHSVSFLCRLDFDRLHRLDAAALAEPVIVLSAPQAGGGVFSLESQAKKPDLLLGDGNHRLARAYLDGVCSLEARLLDRAQSDRYRLR